MFHHASAPPSRPLNPAQTQHKPYERKLLAHGLTEDEVQQLRDFMDDKGELGQEIDWKFSSYERGSPLTRGARATIDLTLTKRAGWVERGVADAGNIAHHCRSLAAFVQAYQGEGMPQNRDHLVALAEVHDKAEAIIGDFTPKLMRDLNISSAMKGLLEKAAIAILYESTALSEEKALIEEYEERKTQASQIVSNIDKCYAVMEALHIEQNSGKHQGLFDEVLNTATDKINQSPTKAGVELLKALSCEGSREQVMAQFRQSQAAPSCAASR